MEQTRRSYLEVVGTLGVAALAGCSRDRVSPSGTPRPTVATDATFDGYLSTTTNFDGDVADARGETRPTVEVGVAGNGGNRAYAPAAIAVDPGTTVVWEWLVDGVAHDVRAKDGAFESAEVDQVGERYGVTFEGERVWKYECVPHSERGMRGVVVVGQPGSRDPTAATVLGGLGLIGLLFALARSLADRGDEGDAGGSPAVDRS